MEIIVVEYVEEEIGDRQEEPGTRIARPVNSTNPAHGLPRPRKATLAERNALTRKLIAVQDEERVE